MNQKRFGMMLLFAVAIVATMLACSFAGVTLVSKNDLPTATPRPTRGGRPTFTPRPPDTATDVPTDVPTDTEVPTEAVTETPVPATKAPTRRPATRAPTRPAVTAAPTAVPATKNPFKYSFAPYSCGSTDDPAICNVQNGVGCRHSGNHEINVLVFSNYKDPNSQLAGQKVRFSGAPGGGAIDPDETTGGDGKATKTLSAVGSGANAGTYFVWLIGNGQPISPFSPPIVINNENENSATTCYAATVVFVGGK